MTADRHNTSIILRAGYFYAAGYFGLGALCLLVYQTFIWWRLGAWIPYQMWLVLVASGWQHPPSLWLASAQPAFDRAWDTIGNCPISIVLSILALIAACLGVICSSTRQTAALHDAR